MRVPLGREVVGFLFVPTLTLRRKTVGINTSFGQIQSRALCTHPAIVFGFKLDTITMASSISLPLAGRSHPPHQLERPTVLASSLPLSWHPKSSALPPRRAPVPCFVWKTNAATSCKTATAPNPSSEKFKTKKLQRLHNAVVVDSSILLIPWLHYHGAPAILSYRDASGKC